MKSRKRTATTTRVFGAALLLLFALAACGAITLPPFSGGEDTLGADVTPDPAQPPDPPTRIEAVVTRIVERTVFVTSTPLPVEENNKSEVLVELDVSQEGRLLNLDPQSTSRPSQFDLGENLFVGLTNYNPQSDTIEPELATSWSVGPDGRTWTFTLRDDINWVRPGPRPDEGELWPVELVRPVVA